MKKKILILGGGISKERLISLETAEEGRGAGGGEDGEGGAANEERGAGEHAEAARAGAKGSRQGAQGAQRVEGYARQDEAEGVELRVGARDAPVAEAGSGRGWRQRRPRRWTRRQTGLCFGWRSGTLHTPTSRAW